MERMYDKVAHSDEHVRLMDLDRVVCPYYPICDPVVSGDIVRVDGQHISPQYALDIVDQVTTMLQRERVIG